jgi:hypothetical protein
MKPKTLLIYLIGVFLLLPLNLQAKTQIAWNPGEVEETILIGSTKEALWIGFKATTDDCKKLAFFCQRF